MCFIIANSGRRDFTHRTHTSEGLKGEARARTNPVPVKMKFATVDGTKHKGSLFVLSVLMASCGAQSLRDRAQVCPRKGWPRGLSLRAS